MTRASSPRTALILGPSGRFGSAMADALWQAGWRIRLFDRSRHDLVTEAQGVDVIVNGWNSPYEHWAKDLPQQTEAVIAAAQASGARVLFPGNVYVYGNMAGHVLRAETAHAATNPLGRLRIEAEAVYRASGIKLLILRAGDFIDTQASGNWYDRIITKPLPKGRIDYPGALDSPHAWAFLPDLARASVMLLDSDLPDQDEVLFPGYTMSANQMAGALSSATGREITARRMPWWPLRIGGLVAPFLRKLIEMRYLWDMPHSIDPAPFAKRLPGFAPTPVQVALAQTSPVIDLADARPPKPDHGATQPQRRSPAQAT